MRLLVPIIIAFSLVSCGTTAVASDRYSGSYYEYIEAVSEPSSPTDSSGEPYQRSYGDLHVFSGNDYRESTIKAEVGDFLVFGTGGSVATYLGDDVDFSQTITPAYSHGFSDGWYVTAPAEQSAGMLKFQEQASDASTIEAALYRSLYAANGSAEFESSFSSGVERGNASVTVGTYYEAVLCDQGEKETLLSETVCSFKDGAHIFVFQTAKQSRGTALCLGPSHLSIVRSFRSAPFTFSFLYYKLSIK